MKSTFYWYNTQKNYQTIGTWFNLHIFLPIWLLMHAIPYERVFQHTWGILHNKTHNSFVLEKEKTTSVTINGYLFLFQAGFIVQLCNNSPFEVKASKAETRRSRRISWTWIAFGIQGNVAWGETQDIVTLVTLFYFLHFCILVAWMRGRISLFGAAFVRKGWPCNCWAVHRVSTFTLKY